MSGKSTTTLNGSIELAPYPPNIPKDKNQTVAPHDRPYALYGQLALSEIDRLGHFNFTNVAPPKGKKPRVNAKAVSASVLTTITKETMHSMIHKKFENCKYPKKMDYVCVASTIDETCDMQRLYVQIIFNELIDTDAPFDHITNCHWAYQIASNDECWNEYIKRGQQYKESGRFKSVYRLKTITWNQILKSQKIDEKIQSSTTRARMDESTCQALIQQSEYDWVDGVESVKLKRKQDYFYDISQMTKRCQQIEHQAKITQRRSINYYDQFSWIDSFPDCTPVARAKTDYWLETSFFTDERGQALIIIGGSRLGKTSFALSLPGAVNYIKENWCLAEYNDHARYNVFDDLVWDKWHKIKNFPDKKSILTRQKTCTARDFPSPSRSINVNKPTIVLLNREDAGSLLAVPRTPDEVDIAKYWEKNAFIIELEEGEYYTKPKSPPSFNIRDAEKYRTYVTNMPEMIEKSLRWHQTHEQEEQTISVITSSLYMNTEEIIESRNQTELIENVTSSNSSSQVIESQETSEPTKTSYLLEGIIEGLMDIEDNVEEEIDLQDTVATIENEGEMVVDNVDTNNNSCDNIAGNMKRKGTSSKNLFIDWKPTINIGSNLSQKKKKFKKMKS